MSCRARPLPSALLAVALLAWSSLAGGVLPRSTPALAAQEGPDPGGRGEALEAVRLLGAALQRHASLPGLALAVGDTSGILVSEAFGVADLETRAPATPMTRWRVGSVGKSFTASGLVLLAEEHALRLDAPVASLLPSWEARPAGRATLRQLAGHLGGIRHYEEGEYLGTVHYDGVSDALDLFADDSLVAAPAGSTTTPPTATPS